MNERDELHIWQTQELFIQPMMIWLILIALTAAVMAGLLLPILGHRDPPAERAEYDRVVFRDQLTELDRDVARGVIGAAEADAARNEISRRLLRGVSAKSGRKAGGHTRLIALIGVLLVPAVALPLYMQRGHPGLADVPLAARLETAIENQDIEAMIAKVEQHMAGKPDDVQGWLVLAPSYKRMQRWDDAVNAYANILRLGKAAPAMIADYGEAVVFANEGMVTAEAHRAFTEALKLDPKIPKARYFDGLALKQEGKRDGARAAFQALLADSPADAPWRGAVDVELKNLDAGVPALSGEQMAAGASMSATGRQAMIGSMVDGLEEKLKADANNLEGWQRLIRARSVLGETGKAQAALAAAREQFKDQPGAITALDGLAKELNML